MRPLASAWWLAAVLLAATVVPAHAGGNCADTTVGFVPLNDLGAGTYHGVVGGLYGGGSNQRPPSHDDAGVAIAQAMTPLDTLGNPDATHGRVVLISIGMSNTTMEFSQFVPLAMNWSNRNPRLNVIDCAEGGMSVDRIIDPSSSYYVTYWNDVVQRLRSHGASPAQVQAVWLKEAIAGPRGDFTASTDTLARDLATLVRLIHQKLPNTKLTYMTSRIYAGYATGVSTLNPEPYAYQSAFAVRSVIQQQIAGIDSLRYDPALGAVQAPWLAWGPYLWADGTHARSDGLTWTCAEFQNDGTHPAASAQVKVADSLLAFFTRDETTRPWFARGAATDVRPGPRPGVALAVRPNPFTGTVEFRITTPATWRLELMDLAGRRVRSLAGHGVAAVTWDGRDARGAPVAPGVYLARMSAAGTQLVRRVVRAAP